MIFLVRLFFERKKYILRLPELLPYLGLFICFLYYGVHLKIQSFWKFMVRKKCNSVIIFSFTKQKDLKSDYLNKVTNNFDIE